MPEVAARAPFGPYHAVEGADPRAQMLGFLEWVADGIWRTHEMTRMNLAYSRALYEGAARAATKSPKSKARVAPPPPAVYQQNAPGINDVLFEAGRYVVGNRREIASILRGLFK